MAFRQCYIENSMLNRDKIFQGITHQNKSTSSNKPLHPEGLIKIVDSSMMTDANKENNNSDLVISWDDFQDNFDETNLNQVEVHHVNTKKALELPIKPSTSYTRRKSIKSTCFDCESTGT